MDDANIILFLLLAASLGYALFIAGHEFINGLKAAKLEHDARIMAGKRAGGPHASDFNEGAKQQKETREEKAQPPPWEEPPRSRAWYDVLEVSPVARLDEIKTAYRRMVVLYHPDRMAGFGAEVRELAEARTKEINAAYTLACKKCTG